MATTDIREIAPYEGRTAARTVIDVLDYITDGTKTRGGELVSAFGCFAETAAFEMLALHRKYEQQTGRRVDAALPGGKKGNLLLSLRQSFAPDEVTPEEAHRIGRALARQFFGEDYQVVVTTHVNTHCVHNHIAANIVGEDLRKFRTNKFSYKKVRQLSDKLCKEHRLSVLPPDCGRRHPLYSKRKEGSYRLEMKNDIDRAVEESASFEEFLSRMEQQYYVNATGKHLSFRHRTNGQQRNIRAYTLGGAYTGEALKERLSSGEETIEQRVVSSAQSAKNAEAMFAAAAWFRKNGIRRYSQIGEKLEELTGLGKQISAQLEVIGEQTEKLQVLLLAARDFQECAPAYGGLQTALLKGRYREENREKLERYAVAKATLSRMSADPQSVNPEKLALELSAYQEKAAALSAQWEGEQGRMAELNKMKRVIDRVYENKAVVTEREETKRDR